MKYLYFLFFLLLLKGAEGQQTITTKFGLNTGTYGKLLDELGGMLITQQHQKMINGKMRTIFVPWVRDNVHTVKAMKYIVPDIRSFTELFLELQNHDGMYMDYAMPITNEVNNRFNFFEPKYFKVLPRDEIQLHRQPVEADNEYLVVEGAYAIYQASGDTNFVRKWLPALEKGLNYMMHDPIRWSSKYQLVKRAYTIDTWDFIYLPISIEEFHKRYGDPTQGIMVVRDTSFMGIMHGDNSGLYAGCRQVAAMHRALHDSTAASIWDKQAEIIRLRTNSLCWNGRFYAHFVPDNGQPPYLKMDEWNTLSLSNTYDINRGLPDEAMSESIISRYLNLKETKVGFAEWYALYPPVRPDYAGVAADTYVNGGIITPVAGELAKAAFQHGYEEYGVNIIKRIAEITDDHHGYLPVCFTPSGKVDGGLPDCWGQAAVYSALIEGLAGVKDNGATFSDTEISPRWLAARINDADIQIAYGASGRNVLYKYHHHPLKKTITLEIAGGGNKIVRILMPEGSVPNSVKLDGERQKIQTEKIRNSLYAIVRTNEDKPTIRVKY